MTRTSRGQRETGVTTLADLEHIEDVIWLEDHEVLTERNGWWRLETEGSALPRLLEKPRGQAVIWRGSASVDDSGTRVLLTQAIGGPFLLAVATDSEFARTVEVAVTSNHEEIARRMGEVLETWLFCGHDFIVRGTAAPILP